MFARDVRFRGEFHTRYSAVVALVGIKHAFDDDAGCGGGFTRVCHNSFSGNLTRLTMLLAFTVIFRALLNGGIFGGNSTRICRCCRFWRELQTRSSMIKALAGI